MKHLDSVLIEQAQRGDSEAFDTVIRQYKGLAFKLARRCFLAYYDTDDMVQEACLALANAVKTYDTNGKRGFFGYAEMCIKNRLNDLIKSETRLKRTDPNGKAIPIDEDDPPEEAGTIDPVDTVIDEEAEEIFYGKLQKILTQNEFSVLKLYLDGYTYKEIAVMLNTTSKRIDNVVYSAKKKVKEVI